MHLGETTPLLAQSASMSQIHQTGNASSPENCIECAQPASMVRGRMVEICAEKHEMHLKCLKSWLRGSEKFQRTREESCPRCNNRIGIVSGVLTEEERHFSADTSRLSCNTLSRVCAGGMLLGAEAGIIGGFSMNPAVPTCCCPVQVLACITPTIGVCVGICCLIHCESEEQWRIGNRPPYAIPLRSSSSSSSSSSSRAKEDSVIVQQPTLS